MTPLNVNPVAMMTLLAACRSTGTSEILKLVTRHRLKNLADDENESPSASVDPAQEDPIGVLADEYNEWVKTIKEEAGASSVYGWYLGNVSELQSFLSSKLHLVADGVYLTEEYLIEEMVTNKRLAYLALNEPNVAMFSVRVDLSLIEKTAHPSLGQVAFALKEPVPFTAYDLTTLKLWPAV